MSLQWTFIATFLYTEIALVVLLMLPFISASRWQKVFRSRLLSSFTYYANIYFNIFIIILLVLFFDAIRDVRRYSDTHQDEGDLRNNPAAEAMMHMKLFRAQRNFYIAGFALFLFLVLRRLVTLISYQATMEADVTATKKQAESATAAAKKLMEEQDNKANESKGGTLDASKVASVTKELDATRVQLKKVEAELQRANVDLSTMRKQAEATNTEYDRLSKEHAQLQEKMKALEGGAGGKKDD